MAKKKSSVDFTTVSKKGSPILVIHRESTGVKYEFQSLDEVLTFDDAEIMDDQDAMAVRSVELYDELVPDDLLDDVKASQQPFKDNLAVRTAFGYHFAGYLEQLAGELSPGESKPSKNG